MTELPSWRPGPTRDRLLAFLDEASHLPVERRIAVLDNDGTMWCEKPRYIQLDFMVDQLRSAVAKAPTIAGRTEYAAVLSGDPQRVAEVGLPAIALALAELGAGLEPEVFADLVREFVFTTRHPTLETPYASVVYQPMLELLQTLRARGFTPFVVTGGGTEFVRAVSRRLYGIPPERVVGTLIGYELSTGEHGPVLRRTGELFGALNEGPAKIETIQRFIGRRPILAVGNTAGDADMLAYTSAGPGPSLGVVITHDDDVREFAYGGAAASFEAAVPFEQQVQEAGWLAVSMRTDWSTVFRAAGPEEL